MSKTQDQSKEKQGRDQSVLVVTITDGGVLIDSYGDGKSREFIAGIIDVLKAAVLHDPSFDRKEKT